MIVHVVDGTYELFRHFYGLRRFTLFNDVEALRWKGPTREFIAWTERMGAPRLLERSKKALAKSA